MNDEHRDPEFEPIARLIREEEEAALAVFRRRDFGRRVMARLEESKQGKRGRFRLWKILVPTTAALFLIAAGAVLLLHRARISDSGGATRSFISVLQDLPGLAELASRRDSAPGREEDIQNIPQSIRDGLAMAGRQKANEEENVPPPKRALDVPRLSLEKKMAVLFKDRAIERVLVSVREKSKEV